MRHSTWFATHLLPAELGFALDRAVVRAELARVAAEVARIASVRANVET